jgi:hypothetical protein
MPILSYRRRKDSLMLVQLTEQQRNKGDISNNAGKRYDLRKVYRSKNRPDEFSFKITLPIEWIKEQRLEEGGLVKVTIDNKTGKLLVEKAKVQ